MKTRQRAAAIIIKDKKLLLVKDNLLFQFHLPGGEVKAGEDNTSALKRELLEEIGVKLTTTVFFYSFDLINQAFKLPQTDHTYIVDVKGTPKPKSEIIKVKWFSLAEINEKSNELPKEFIAKLIPRLVEKQLI